MNIVFVWMNRHIFDAEFDFEGPRPHQKGKTQRKEGFGHERRSYYQKASNISKPHERRSYYQEARNISKPQGEGYKVEDPAVRMRQVPIPQIWLQRLQTPS